jgi:type II secretory pathway pseudopilin PulG
MKRGASSEQGFALLVLLMVVGAGSIAIVLAAQAMLPNLAERAAHTDERLAACDAAARAAFRRNGAFPTNMDSLATAAALEVDPKWRFDPWSPAVDFVYTRNATRARFRSVGPDRRRNTGDDVVVDVAIEPQLRVRQRPRLRLIRAVLLRSQYRFAPTMSPGELDAMRDAMRDQAVALRQWLTATADERTALTSRLSTSATTIANLVTAHGLTALPSSLTGASGLMSRLGMPDGRAVDGGGAALLRHLQLGVVARGADGRGGTDDDM